jgi:hypothetical protein
MTSTITATGDFRGAILDDEEEEDSTIEEEDGDFKKVENGSHGMEFPGEWTLETIQIVLLM